MKRAGHFAAPVSAGVVLEGAIPPGRGLGEIVAAWPKAAGARLAANTWPMSFQGATLIVAARGTSRPTHLKRVAAQLVGRINEVLGRPAVSTLLFVEAVGATGTATASGTGTGAAAGTAPGAGTDPSHRVGNVPSHPDTLTLPMQAALTAVPDPDLRARLESAMRKRRPPR